ncbi:AraC family transcriptional regulator [Lipingzhangella sp. LS1_29]|uniref:AraC family transcriptional regulator n=1 Tax=Lipingzhangella rawalii TaxID=2055835 RepID=A0ABU2H261_9ACTN|nr:AraC family transcriptional regulator [Lipingzhangella rawalii]MDS1269377.1 AraC family transcriptional regulator [Lipingzhangella rawalii]
MAIDADSTAEYARFWRSPGLPDVDLLTARFVRHRYNRHTHETYTVALVEAGVEEYLYDGQTHRVGAGEFAVVEPGVVHTGHAGVPTGWSYRVMYPSVELVTTIARENGIRGTPAFRMPTLRDTDLAVRFRQAHRAAEDGDQLASSTLLRAVVSALLLRHSRPARHTATSTSAPAALAAQVRDLLHGQLVDPPRLDTLAAMVEVSPYALVRTFRADYGLPPHAYLNQLRVQHARSLLAAGVAAGDVAIQVGFADQPHLTRHFKRAVGVGPAAYQRGVRAVR